MGSDCQYQKHLFVLCSEYYLVDTEVYLSVRSYLRVDLAGELQSPQVGSVSTLILLHRMTDETQTTCLCSIHYAGSKDKLLSQRDTNSPGEALCTTYKRETINLDETWPQPQRLMIIQVMVI